MLARHIRDQLEYSREIDDEYFQKFIYALGFRCRCRNLGHFIDVYDHGRQYLV